jgi:hypothetical protein
VRSLVLLILAACASAPAPVEVIPCGRVWLRATPPPERRLDLIVRVHGEVCHREPLVMARRSRLARLCGLAWFAPGDNQIEVRVARGCTRPIARAALRCALPEPD